MGSPVAVGDVSKGAVMVWIGVGRRRRRGGWNDGYGVYGPPPYRQGYRSNGCLRDLFFAEAGCCIAESLGCGPQLVLLGPAAVRLLLQGPVISGDGLSRAQRLVRLYQARIGDRRGYVCCRMTPSCSAYAFEALGRYGTWRGARLAAARLLRCRPGGPVGADPVR